MRILKNLIQKKHKDWYIITGLQMSLAMALCALSNFGMHYLFTLFLLLPFVSYILLIVAIAHTNFKIRNSRIYQLSNWQQN